MRPVTSTTADPTTPSVSVPRSTRPVAVEAMSLAPTWLGLGLGLGSGLGSGLGLGLGSGLGSGSGLG